MFAISHKNTSLNRDRSTVLKSWDKSEIGMLRVVTNEIIHSVTTGDYRGLRIVLEHVEDRKQVFSTVRAIVKATTGKAIVIGTGDDGLTVRLAKKPADRTFVETNMTKLVAARDTDTIGLFNSSMLASIGIGGAPKEVPFDLAKAAASLVKRAVKAKMEPAQVVNAVTAAFAHYVEKDAAPTEEDNEPGQEGLEMVA